MYFKNADSVAALGGLGILVLSVGAGRPSMLNTMILICKIAAYFVLGLASTFLYYTGKCFQRPRITRWGANELFVEWAAELNKWQYRLRWRE